MTTTYEQHCDAMRAFLPGFPYMLDEAAQGDESYSLECAAIISDSPTDWEIIAIDEGQQEFAGEWEHSCRP